MKGKLFIFFLLALAALVVVALIGRTTINSSIESIRQASQPNEKREILEKINESLLSAEAGIRTFTITGDAAHLKPITETSINDQLDQLKAITNNSAQRAVLEEMKRVVDEKFRNYSSLITLKQESNDSNSVDRIMADIEAMRDTSASNEEVYEQLFGEDQQRLASDSLFEASGETDLSSEQVEQALARVQQEQLQNEESRRQKELALTQQDQRYTEEFRSLVNDFQAIDQDKSISQVEGIAEASENAQLSITLITALTVLTFAILLFVLFRDLSRNQRNREELRIAKIKAEKLARAKEEFLANMSHEIRTPLNAVIGFSEQLRNQVSDPQGRSAAGKIHKSSQHLLALVNDILDSARLESGKITLEQIPFNVQQEIDDIHDLFEIQVKKKSLVFNYHVDPSVPEVLIGDPMRIRQIIINLLSNALKFTESGSISMDVKTMNLDENRATIQVAISDTGIGISKEQQSYIFEDFSQADSSTTRKYGGTGLGLSIVKKLVDMFEGDIIVNSEPGEGTTFMVTMSMAVGKSGDLPEKPSPATTPQLSGHHILIVDDQPFNLEVARNLVLETGASVTTAASGEAAWEILMSESFDMILLDVQMPGISGTELCRKIRESESFQDLPVLALTAGTTPEEKEEVEAAGMNDIVYKPIEKEILFHCLSRHLSTNLIDLDSLKSIGDQAFVTRMLKLFQENITGDLEKLTAAVDQNNPDEVKSLAHKMIPPCRHLGLNSLVASLEEIQSSEEAVNHRNSLPDIQKQVEIALLSVERELSK